MCARLLCCAVVVVLAWPDSACAQQARENAPELRRQMEVLEAQLRRLEQQSERADRADRVTQIGSMRQGRTPEMIVKMYDLSDLFAVAPPYEAMRMSDLGGPAAALFPVATAPQLSGMGGMGGMGGGISTTLRIPVERTVLVGGMTFQGQPDADSGNLYLFIAASVNELRDEPPSDGVHREEPQENVIPPADASWDPAGTPGT
jgi:hypothetical protein